LASFKNKIRQQTDIVIREGKRGEDTPTPATRIVIKVPVDITRQEVEEASYDGREKGIMEEVPNKPKTRFVKYNKKKKKLPTSMFSVFFFCIALFLYLYLSLSSSFLCLFLFWGCGMRMESRSPPIMKLHIN